ncbi:hypothetical protein L3Q82_018324 [Scortum barcoo]|uniref:Uncharacterized protein n=1 Tax=Scortum barcoo TaxID=214431 RepID=A0ACB8VIK3_9TELE|nr:hypothetical protein L3Q82_018324 [Scortum barcoo]
MSNMCQSACYCRHLEETIKPFYQVKTVIKSHMITHIRHVLKVHCDTFL